MFNKANLAVAALAAKPRDNRGSCTHVLISEQGMVATDGHVLGLVSPLTSEALDKPFTPFLIKAADLTAINRNMNGGSIHVSAENTLHVESKIGPIDVAASDEYKAENFPKWEAVMPEKEKATLTVGFNPTLLIRALTLMGSLEYCELRFSDADSVLRIDGRTEDGQNITSLVMPRRAER